MADHDIALRLVHRYPGFVLDVDLSLPGRGVTALFGHSGSGKTTVLRCVAGLERAAQGLVRVGGEAWQAGATFVPAWRRPVGYVFQEPSLFAHLDVRANMAFGMRRTPGGVDAAEMGRVAELLGISALLDRSPGRLSGGERQRVAIARALLARPRLLLMDEPLSALDASRKEDILPYLERLHETLAIPVLYVTHQIEEVARLADHVVLMAQGQALASGPLDAVLNRLDLPLAREHEAGVVVHAHMAEHLPAWHLTRLVFPGGEIFVSQRSLAVGRAVRVRILARDVSLSLDELAASSIQNRFPCVVTSCAPAADPAQVLVGLDARGVQLFARVTRRAVEQLRLAPGLTLWAQVKAVALLD